MCSPQAAGWDSPATRNTWQSLGFLRAPNFLKAQQEHDGLCRQLQSAGAELLHLPPSADLSLDAVYAHDASFMTLYGAVILNPGKPNRVVEAARHREFYGSAKIPILGEMSSPATMEAGDMLWLDASTLLVGRGSRTNAAGIAQLRDMVCPHGVEVLAAPLPYSAGPAACLHLMSLVSLLDDSTALVDLPWLAVETVELLQARAFRLVEIDYSERETLACNVLSLGKKRLLAIAENVKTNSRLQRKGFEVLTFAGSELCLNGSGGPTCLTRPLLRG